jgi:opacity protein-like surface antigen
MKKFLYLCVVLGLAAIMAASASAQSTPAPDAKEAPKQEDKKETASPLVGKWQITISAPGQDLPGTLTLEKDGDKYKGSVNTALGEAPLSNIKIEGGKLSADITVNAQGTEMQGTITAEATDTGVKGDINLPGFPPIGYTGKKTS